jgi:hypothetical protein
MVKEAMDACAGATREAWLTGCVDNAGGLFAMQTSTSQDRPGGPMSPRWNPAEMNPDLDERRMPPAADREVHGCP